MLPLSAGQQKISVNIDKCRMQEFIFFTSSELKIHTTFDIQLDSDWISNLRFFHFNHFEMGIFRVIIVIIVIFNLYNKIVVCCNCFCL